LEIAIGALAILAQRMAYSTIKLEAFIAERDTSSATNTFFYIYFYFFHPRRISLWLTARGGLHFVSHKSFIPFIDRFSTRDMLGVK